MRPAGAALLLLAIALFGCRQDTPPTEPPAAEYVYVSPLPSGAYTWPRQSAAYEPLAARFPPPSGFERAELPDDSFGEWLRNLPLLPEGAPVVDERGHRLPVARTLGPAAVVDMDVRRFQECADVILRLRAEYLRWSSREDEIVFHLTGPGTISWPEWRSGMRPRLEGDRLVFERTAEPDDSRESFDRFLASVFEWCGTISLESDGQAVRFEDVQVGNYFTRGGSPGHAVIIVDLARNDAGELRALILQGYMPAQSPHVLTGGEPGAWFALDAGSPLRVPWGSFTWEDVRRFSDAP